MILIQFSQDCEYPLIPRPFSHKTGEGERRREPLPPVNIGQYPSPDVGEGLGMRARGVVAKWIVNKRIINPSFISRITAV